jgi:hypothetical protein
MADRGSTELVHLGFDDETLCNLNGSMFEHTTTLDVGCGRHKLPNSIGIDMLKLDGVDVVHDLNSSGWPIPAASTRSNTSSERTCSLARCIESRKTAAK